MVGGAIRATWELREHIVHRRVQHLDSRPVRLVTQWYQGILHPRVPLSQHIIWSDTPSVREERRHFRSHRHKSRSKTKCKKRSRSSHIHKYRDSSTSDTEDERATRKPRIERATTSDILTALERFQRMAPPKFSGKGGAEASETWLTEMESLLDGLGYSTREMATLTVFSLKDIANSWWRWVKKDRRSSYHRKGQKDTGVRWSEFSNLFHDRWIGYSTRESRIAEFDALQQGALSVTV